MAKMPRLLRRGPVVDEAEFELTRLRTLERLERMRTGADASTEFEMTDEDADVVQLDDGTLGEVQVAGVAMSLATSADDDTGHPAELDISDADADEDATLRRDLINRGPITLPDRLVSVMAAPGEFGPEPAIVPSPDEAEAIPDPGARDPAPAPDADQAPAPAPDADQAPANGNGHRRTAAFEAETVVVARPEEVAEPATERRSGPPHRTRAATRPAGRPGAKGAKRTASVASTHRVGTPGPAPASCPYCALLLVPAPEASRRCVRCRQRIIVRRADGRAVYLTEAAVLVFEAERRRVANSGRWTRERERWLRLATAAGASPARLKRLAAAPLSEEVVTGVRSLYLATVERTFRAAKRDRRWQDSARIRRDHAMALYRAAGSPNPPPDDVLALYREAAMADLRGLAEFRRDAALVAAKCCEACQADDGRAFRIARELHTPRLPHAGCPRGLCGCRWDLAERDRSLVARYLRRRTPG